MKAHPCRCGDSFDTEFQLASHIGYIVLRRGSNAGHGRPEAPLADDATCRTWTDTGELNPLAFKAPAKHTATPKPTTTLNDL